MSKPHHFIWNTEIQANGKLRRVGSACILCGRLVYSWGGFVGPCEVL